MAKDGNMKGVIELVNGDITLLNSADNIGYTPLHWALIRAHWELSECLIDKGADLNAAGNDGGTPLHCAANHEYGQIVQLMLSKGAIVDPKNLWGNTPLALAAQRGCNSIVDILIRNGADVNSASNERWTPLHYAYKAGHQEMIRNLLNHGASDTLTDNFGKRPSDYFFKRPVRSELDPEFLNDYVGAYYIGPDSYFHVTLRGDILYLEDVALDEIYPIAYDQFYDYREPWKIRFFRNQKGEVDIIAVDFQRQTVVGKKVKSDDATPSRPRLGVATRPLNPEDINQEVLNTLFFVVKANACALMVTQVGEDTPASRAGMLVNDIILEFGNEPLMNSGDLVRMLYSVDAGQEVVVKILRNSSVIYVGLSFNQ